MVCVSFLIAFVDYFYILQIGWLVVLMFSWFESSFRYFGFFFGPLVVQLAHVYLFSSYYQNCYLSMCRNLRILASSILMVVKLDEDFDVCEHQTILSTMIHNQMRCVQHQKKEQNWHQIDLWPSLLVSHNCDNVFHQLHLPSTMQLWKSSFNKPVILGHSSATGAEQQSFWLAAIHRIVIIQRIVQLRFKPGHEWVHCMNDLYVMASGQVMTKKVRWSAFLHDAHCGVNDLFNILSYQTLYWIVKRKVDRDKHTCGYLEWTF